jgi:signal transduction histidine kinase/DNA-binding NarL/FixJ family response regulator
MSNEAIRQIKQEIALAWNQVFHQSVLNLMGRSVNPIRLIGESYNEEKELPHQEKLESLVIVLHFNKLFLCYLFSKYAEAVENSTLAESHLSLIRGIILEPLYYLYDSLARLATYPGSSAQVQSEIIKKVALSQEKMKHWAHYAPMNYFHKYHLVQAETARVLGQLIEAEEFYEQAILGAKDNEYLQEEALAYELAAKFYLSRDREKIAQTYMKEAHYCYERWGATAKVKDLETRYPQLLTQSPTVTRTTSTRTTNPRTTTGNSSGEALDLATVMKASQAISGEIVLERLLGSLMQILIENAGAQTGFLILDKEGKWVIEASGIVNSDAGDSTHIAEVLKSAPIRDRLSVSIVNYVVRTKESLVVSDAAKESDFATEPYIKTHQTKSILCAPLVNQGDLVGIVYLENNLAAGAFTQNRVEVLQLLSGQAAIAITNAKFYAERQQAEKLLADYNRTLEEQVAARTLELEREIAERKRAEEAAQAANRAKSIFLANMSHELRTPLNAIIGFSQLINRSSTLHSEHQENLDIITRSGEHLLTLINQVLDLSKIEAGRTTLNETKFNLHRVLRDLEDMFQLKAKDKGLQLLFDFSSDVPRYVHTDEVKLRQVLINLLNNAIKFTCEGSVSLKVKNESEQQRTHNIDAQAVSRKVQKTTITFEVEDTGAGIASDELDSLFEAFMQTKTGQQSQEGTGLGLTIAHSFVQLMGGEMTVSSYVGKGTTFKFDIQATVVKSIDSKSQQPTRRAITLEPNQPRYRILIVDDLWDNRQLLIKLLSPLGFELQEASNGQEAIAIWDTWEPHLIWMDIRMPVMDGIEATQRIKATPKGQHTVIVALTASVLEEKRNAVIAAGCAEFIRKPFREADIFDAMHKHIGVRFVYEEPTAIPTSTENNVDVLTPAAFASLPSDLIANLRQAILSLDIESMQSYITQISELDHSLAEAIATLAKDFKYKQLLTLTQPTTD